MVLLTSPMRNSIILENTNFLFSKHEKIENLFIYPQPNMY